MTEPSDISGKTLATWESPYTFGLADTRITAGKKIGEYEEKNAALSAACARQGGEAVVKSADGRFALYAILNGSSSFTRENIEQAERYPVANVTTAAADTTDVVALITADNFELDPPSVHHNPNTGVHYSFPRQTRFSRLSFLPAESYRSALTENSTNGLDHESLRGRDIQEVLRSTLDILDIYDPWATDWVRGLGNSDVVLLPSDGFVAVYQPFHLGGGINGVGDVILGDDFWHYNDLDKASFLYHEYIHWQEGSVARAYAWWMSGGEYAKASEDRAYLAQRKMLKYFGVSFSGEAYRDVGFYLAERGLL